MTIRKRRGGGVILRTLTSTEELSAEATSTRSHSRSDRIARTQTTPEADRQTPIRPDARTNTIRRKARGGVAAAGSMTWLADTMASCWSVSSSTVP